MPFRLSSIVNEELIHDAVRQGHVISLEIYLNQNPSCINKLFTYNLSKWTPLLAGCYYKHEHIVRMLLNRFKPDIEVKGTVRFDLTNDNPELVEDVSPLWTAVAVDHFDIVRLLIERGNANINYLTKNHSTPFRVACFNNNLEMAKYLVEHNADPYQMKIGNYTNLMLSAGRQYPSIVNYLVNDLKCDINQQDENGQTALYYAVKSGSSEIVKFLLEHGALHIRDKLRRVTPLMRAALYGEIHLIELFDGYCSDLEWIEAKELLGATLGGCVARLENRNKSIQYLTEAFELRVEKNLPKILSDELIEIFDYRSECQTFEQFNQLISSDTKDALRIETIRIHQRLLGELSNDYHHVLRYHGAVLADTCRYDDSLRWWFHELDLKEKHKIHFKKEYLRCFISIFNEMKQNKQMNIPTDALLKMLKTMDNVLRLNRCNEDFDYHLYTLLYLVTVIARIIYSTDKELSSNERQDLCKAIRLIIWRKYQSVQSGLSLLHLCSSSLTNCFTNEINYPCGMTVRLLIDCAANVDVLDSDKNTPLHLLVRHTGVLSIFNIIDILCLSGAHLDHVNNKGKTPIESVPSIRKEIIQYLKEKMGVSRLKCLCARLIRQEKWTCQDILPTSLVNFVQKH